MNDQEFKDFVLEKRNELLFVARSYLQKKDKAEDALQEVFISLWRNKDNLNKETVFHYAKKSVRNKCFTILKREKSKREFEMLLFKPDTPLDLLIKKEIENKIDHYIQSLNLRNRDVYMARIIDGLSIDEMSKLFDLSKNNISVILSRIRTEIHQIINSNE